MLRLIPFELSKIWRKRSFVLALCTLLLIHVFLLWCTSLPNESTPPLSAYKAVNSEISDRNEEEKAQYLEQFKETIDGVCFVRDILAMQDFENEMGVVLAQQEMQERPGVFEKYYELYQSGDYLRFTDSLEQERALAEELYEEQLKAAGYGDYLRSIQENKETLGSISIFGGQAQDTYSFRNLEKSAADYADLTDKNICFTPSKPIVSALEGVWTDLLLFLSVMLFVGGLITEEKELGLFFITRCTKHGVVHSIGAKLAALWLHCVMVTALFYLTSLVFFGQSAGWFPMGAALQSVAAYTESSLSVSVAGYIVLSVMTKALVLFGAAALITAFCIRSGIAALPFLVGLGIAGIGALLYYLIPAGSVASVFKYVNPVGLMKTENLYGGYLNFNMFGYPISRLCVSFVLIGFICVAGIAGSLWMFCRMESLEVRKIRLPFLIPFRLHVSIIKHEGYKILVTNHALVIWLLFAALLIFHSFDHAYTPSVAEQYYKDIMLQLEGELTKEKEMLVLSEKARFDQAFQELDQIEELVSNGGLSHDAADMLKAEANMTLSFYPAFQKVQEQYEHIKKSGGSFVYDTGYRYLFGMLDDDFSVDFLLVSIGLILAAGGAVSMEYQVGSLSLLGATKTGIRKVFVCKLIICMAMAAMLALVPMVCRAICISSVYPMHHLGASVQNIFSCSELPAFMPIGAFALLAALSQMAAAAVATGVTLALSLWRKNQAQTVFFALLILAGR